MAKHFRFWQLINRAPKLRAGVLLFATLSRTLSATLSGTLSATLSRTLFATLSGTLSRTLFATLSGTLFATLFVTPLGAQTSLPNLFARSLEGKEVRLADFLTEGKPLVISFWATWCNPCVEELEAVSQRFESWQKEIDFKFVAISVDDARSTSKVRSFVSGKEWPFTVLLDANQDIMKAMNISTVPFTMILNKQGVVKYSHSGYIPGDENTLIKELKKIIDEK